MSLLPFTGSNDEDEEDEFWIPAEKEEFGYPLKKYKIIEKIAGYKGWLFIGLGFLGVISSSSVKQLISAAVIGLVGFALILMRDSTKNKRYILENHMFEVYNSQKLHWLQTREETGLELHEHLLKEGYGKWAEKAREEYASDQAGE